MDVVRHWQISSWAVPGLRRPCSRGPGSSHDRWDKTRNTVLRHSPNKLPWSHRVAPPGRQIDGVMLGHWDWILWKGISIATIGWRKFPMIGAAIYGNLPKLDWAPSEQRLVHWWAAFNARNWWRYHNFSTLVATPTLGSLGPVVAGLCPPWPSESAWGTARGSHVWWCTCPDEDRPELHYILALPTTKEMVNWGPQTGDNGKKRHEYRIPAKIYGKIFMEQIYACKYICFCHIWNPEWWIWDENGNKDGHINHHPSIHPTNQPTIHPSIYPSINQPFINCSFQPGHIVGGHLHPSLGRQFGGATLSKVHVGHADVRALGPGICGCLGVQVQSPRPAHTVVTQLHIYIYV